MKSIILLFIAVAIACWAKGQDYKFPSAIRMDIGTAIANNSAISVPYKLLISTNLN